MENKSRGKDRKLLMSSTFGRQSIKKNNEMCINSSVLFLISATREKGEKKKEVLCHGLVPEVFWPACVIFWLYLKRWGTEREEEAGMLGSLPLLSLASGANGRAERGQGLYWALWGKGAGGPAY